MSEQGATDLGDVARLVVQQMGSHDNKAPHDFEIHVTLTYSNPQAANIENVIVAGSIAARVDPETRRLEWVVCKHDAVDEQGNLVHAGASACDEYAFTNAEAVTKLLHAIMQPEALYPLARGVAPTDVSVVLNEIGSTGSRKRLATLFEYESALDDGPLTMPTHGFLFEQARGLLGQTNPRKRVCPAVG